MSDQLTKIQPAMIHLDLSNALPARAYSYLTPILPGFFFEISLALANPAFVTKVLSNLPEGFPLSQYVKLGMAVFLAFVIGNGFMMGIILIQWLLGRLYVFGAFLSRQFYSRLLYPILERYMQRPLKPGRSKSMRLAKHYQRARSLHFGMDIDKEQENRGRCLYALTHKLLETRYGIKLEDVGPTIPWHIFSVTLATPTREEWRGEALVNATHATGWCGVVASRLAPSLNNRYYLFFCLLMIVVGLLNDFYVARNFNNPARQDLMNIRGLLREFGKPSRVEAPHSGSKSEPEGGVRD